MSGNYESDFGKLSEVDSIDIFITLHVSCSEDGVTKENVQNNIHLSTLGHTC